MFRFKIATIEIFDLLPDAQLSVLESVIHELQKIAKSRKKDAKHARVALKFVEKLKILQSETAKTDEALLELNSEDVVATNDRELRRRLAAKNIKTIYLRAKKHLALS